MAFNYDKNKQSHASDSFWTSYSDLFLGLSTIFLLLYVVSNLRTGTDAIKNQVDNQKLTMKVEELENQLKMYESVKNNYMDNAAPKDEQQEYQELMDKLTLLQEEAKTEKERLMQEALENGKKGQALNKYQQMVRNIMNANKVAKSRIITRNEIIGEQDTQIEDQKQNITNLEKDITQKTRMIEDGKRQIANTEAVLQKNLTELQKSFQKNKLTRKAYEKQAQKMREDNERKVAELKNTNNKYNQQLVSANQKLNQLNSELQGTQAALSQTTTQLEGTKETLSQTANELQGTQAALSKTSSQLQGTKAALSQTANELQGTQAALSQKANELKGAKDALNQMSGETARLQGQLAQASGEAQGLRSKIAALNSGYAAQRDKDRKAFEDGLNKLKLGAAERASKEAQYRAEANAKAGQLQRQLAGLEGQLRSTEGALAKAKEEIDNRKVIAKEIARGFAQAGIKADVDMGTGEVVLDFGDAYFESDSANLKPKMRQILEKAMPVYSKSLFGNSKIANKISNVEIIGFASPTYQGRFIDPKSTKPEDRAALKYNMDLSYRRANAIFQHIVDEKNPDFSHQQDLMALMKVSGRSFLEVLKVDNRTIASASEFCRVNDCRKAQRVIVRFSMDGKK